MAVFILQKPLQNAVVFRTTKNKDYVIVNRQKIRTAEARKLYNNLIADGYTRVPGYSLDTVQKNAVPYLAKQKYEDEVEWNNSDEEDLFGTYVDPIAENHPGWSEYDEWAGENRETEGSWTEESEYE